MMDEVRCDECGEIIDCECMTCHECYPEATCKTQRIRQVLVKVIYGLVCTEKEKRIKAIRGIM